MPAPMRDGKPEMRVPTRIKHIQRIRAKGRVYYYHRLTGTRLPDNPQSPEFLLAWRDAEASMKPVRRLDQISDLIDRYLDSSDFQALADRTKADYRKHIAAIIKRLGTMPVAALPDRMVRSDLLDWRDDLAKASKKNAQYLFATFARIFAWAKGRGMIDINPLERIGRVYRANRNDKIWTADDEARFMAVAPERMRLAMMLAIWTGQRQGDLLRLTWSAYDGTYIRLRQGKRGARVTVFVAGPLKAALDATKRRGIYILLTEDGKPWSPDGFRTVWGRVCKKAEIEDLTFHDLRGTFITREYLSGATEAEIATVTGLSLRSIKDVLDGHYLSRDPALAESGIRKLERTYSEQKV